LRVIKKRKFRVERGAREAVVEGEASEERPVVREVPVVPLTPICLFIHI